MADTTGPSSYGCGDTGGSYGDYHGLSRSFVEMVAKRHRRRAIFQSAARGALKGAFEGGKAGYSHAGVKGAVVGAIVGAAARGVQGGLESHSSSTKRGNRILRKYDYGELKKGSPYKASGRYRVR